MLMTQARARMTADTRNRLTVAGRACSRIATILVVPYAVVSGVGAPPSEFRQDTSRFVDAASQLLPVYYLIGVLLGLVAVVANAVGARAGRWCGTAACAVSCFADVVCSGMAGPREARFAVRLAAAAIPLVLVIWLPRVAGRSE